MIWGRTLGIGGACSRREFEGREMAVRELCCVRARRREGSGKKSRRTADEEMIGSASTRGALSRVARHQVWRAFRTDERREDIRYSFVAPVY